MKAVFILCLVLAVAFGSPTIKEELVSFSEGRIIGGSDAVANAYPYQISLQYGTGSTKSHRCGGSIVDATHILTAAHCVDGLAASTLIVVAGAHNMKVVEANQQRRDVASFVIHPQWNANNVNNDVAILTLSSALQLNAYVQAIAQAPQGIEASGSAVSTGWGLTVNGGTTLPDALQVVGLTIFARARCQLIYAFINPINAGMICANSPGENKGACNGDSGSPLVCSDLGYNYQCGVVSWGINGQCGNPNYPSVYANTANYYNWIQSQL